jgi:hypothetical protein
MERALGPLMANQASDEVDRVRHDAINRSIARIYPRYGRHRKGN